MRLAEIVRRHARERAAAPAITFGDETLTWAELDTRANRVAHALAAEGIGAQDRIAFLDKNGLEYFDMLFGGAKLNAVNVAVNWRLAPREIVDIVITGGENVDPAAVENALASHPDVADVAVIGVPDERWGETVKAIVVARAGSAPAPDALIAWTRARLAHDTCPTSVDVADALPRNPSGQLLKRELREPYWKGHARRIH